MVLVSAERLPLERSEHVVTVRQLVRQRAVELGFSLVDQTKIVTAASELARNTVHHGGGGPARGAAQQLAVSAGFETVDAHRVGIVATEMATNLVKHARGGELLMRVVAQAPDSEVEVLSLDRAGGMANLAQSMTDGHSTAGSAGIGLGAMPGLSELFVIH